MKKFVFPAFGVFSMVLAGVLSGCGSATPTSRNPGSQSTVTGLEYNEEDGFLLNEFAGQGLGPNLVLVEGGRTVLGSYEEDIMNSHDNLERTVTVATFYMDETEVANVHWLEYLFYVKFDSSREFYQSALPDTTVWSRELAYNDPYVDHYLRYPGFRYFPVVGVSWRQAVDFCKWRTSIVNFKLADESGYEGLPAESGGRIPLETGVVLPDYRLPTEAEWEYAAQAMVGVQWIDEVQVANRIYPWDGHSTRNPYGKTMGTFLANFKRGRGDYAGIAGALNDGSMITDYIYEYPPNDYGLYNMAGNVNEWVQDVYRPMSFADFDDLNPVRRDGFLDDASNYANTETVTQRTQGGGAAAMTLNSLVTNTARVYKGGSWKDVAYWLSPGTRRYLDQDSATATIGFRCAMIRADANN